MKKSLFLLITTFMVCGSVQASSLFYLARNGVNDGVYKVDMTTGSYEQIFSGSFTTSMQQFDSDKIVVSDSAASRILILGTEGTIYNSFPTAVGVHSTIRNPNNPDELLYASYSTGQLRKINIYTGEDSLVASISNAHNLTSRSDGSVFVSSWWATGYRGGMMHDLSNPATSVLTTTWMNSLVGDNYGNIFYSRHPQYNPHSIAKIEFGDTVTDSVVWYNANINIGGITYDSANDRILVFGSQGGQDNLYSFDPNTGTMETLLTNLALPDAQLDVYYTLFLNDGSITVPEPMTLLLLLSGITSFFVRKNIIS